MSSSLRVNQIQDISGNTLNLIRQVKQTVKTNIFSTSSDGFNDVTGLTVDITPISSSSKILAMCYVNYGTASDNVRLAARIVREESGSDTIISQGDASGDRIRAMWIGRPGDFNGAQLQVPIQILDSPSSTNALTYKFQTTKQKTFRQFLCTVNQLWPITWLLLQAHRLDKSLLWLNILNLN